jgi:hypothetical protein
MQSSRFSLSWGRDRRVERRGEWGDLDPKRKAEEELRRAEFRPEAESGRGVTGVRDFDPKRKAEEE